MKKNICFVIIAVLTFNLSGFTASNIPGELEEHAQETKRWVHPRLEFQLEYDDNIFLTPSNKISDFIFIVKPGVFFNVPFSGDTHLFTLDYHTELAAFTDFGDQNYNSHFLLANLDLNFPKFFVKTYDDFRISNLRGDTEFTDRIERKENLFSIDAGTKELNRFFLEAGYDFFLVNYQDTQFDIYDRFGHTFNTTVYYKIRPKTKGLLEYNHEIMDYDDDPTRDGDYDQVRVGLRGQLLPKLIGTVKVGYQNRRYDDSTQDWDSAVVSLVLTEYFRPGTSLNVAYERSARESVYASNNYYSLDSVSVTLYQSLFFERLDGYLGLSYQNNGYDLATTEGGITQERNDDVFRVRVGADYAFKNWLLTGVEYTYQDRDSNFDGFDYSDSRVTWKTSALF